MPLVTILAFLASALGIFAGWLYRRRADQVLRHAALLGAALGTISGICYRYRDGLALRIDGNAGDPAWPLDLANLVARFDESSREDLGAALAALARDGTGFVLSASGADRVVEISGHRVTARDGGQSFDLAWATDITERAALAASDRATALRERHALRSVLDRLPFAVWWRDTPDAALQGNRRFAEAPELAGPAADLTAQTDAGGAQRRVTAKLKPGHEKRSVELVALPLDAGGAIGYARDRTEIDAVRAEIDRLVLGHREVLETVGAAIAIYGPDGRLLFNNTAFERLWGLDHEWLAAEPTLPEVLDHLRERRLLPEYADFRKFKAEQSALLASLTAAREELLHLPDERTLRLRISRHPFGGLTFAYEDVTDKLALERSYNTLIEVQRETLDNLFEGVAVFGSDGRLKLWNPAYAEIWKLSPADLLNRPHIATLVEQARGFYETGQDWERTKAAIIDQVTAYTASSDRLERSDGSVLEVSTVPLPDGNVLLSYLDVTDSERVQRVLWEKNEALETAGRLKSEFLANVSYELRTPLNATIGFAEILSNQYFGPLNERQADYARGILDSSQRLLSLINDILDLATIEAGQLTLDRSPVDVHALLASILALSRERARRLELSLDFNCPPDIGTIMADERRIRQALFNLVSNAIKFTPPGGTVSLGARREGGEVSLIVADTGIGIAMEHHRKVFESFERGDPAARQVGAGLGLSLVKSYIELHGGRVELTSIPGTGTAVTCTLPISPPVALAAQAVPIPARPLRSSIRNVKPRPDAPADGSHAPPAPLRQNRSESA